MLQPATNSTPETDTFNEWRSKLLKSETATNASAAQPKPFLNKLYFIRNFAAEFVKQKTGIYLFVYVYLKRAVTLCTECESN